MGGAGVEAHSSGHWLNAGAVEAILEGTQAGAWVWQVGEGVCYRSAQFKRNLGFLPDELPDIAPSWTDRMHPDDLAAAETALDRHVKSHGRLPLVVEVRLQQRDQTYAWQVCRARVTNWRANGQPMRLAGSFTSLHAERQTLAEHHNNERLLRLCLRRVPAAVAMVDRELRYLFVSDRWYEDYQLEGNIVGQSHYEVFPDLPPEWKAIHERCLNGEVDICNEACFPRADGRQQWLRWEVRPWYSRGEVGGLLILTENITPQKEYQQSLHASIVRLNAKNAQLKDFAYITSHNLRSPISNLRSLLNLHEMDPSAENTEFVLTHLRKVVEQLTATIDGLSLALHINQVENLQRHPVHLVDSFESACTQLAADIRLSGATIETDFAGLEKVSHNRTYIDSIFLNLLSNALKYRAPHRPLHIHLRSWQEEGAEYLSVRDNGLGIDLKRHGRKVFGLGKTFHRHSDSRGVGLFLTKAQVEALGGRIWVESEPDQGAVFNICFNRSL